jgi:FixJ family two-component response regulator
MKWMLIMMVFELAPVKTELLFDSLEDCMNAGDRAIQQHVEAFNRRVASFKIKEKDVLKEVADGELKRIPKSTCVPHAVPK